jgi:hypothetical protein
LGSFVPASRRHDRRKPLSFNALPPKSKLASIAPKHRADGPLGPRPAPTGPASASIAANPGVMRFGFDRADFGDRTPLLPAGRRRQDAPAGQPDLASIVRLFDRLSITAVAGRLRKKRSCGIAGTVRLSR